MPDGQFSVLSPIPVYPPVKLISELANFTLSGLVAIKILGRDQHSSNQDGGINRRELAVPGALPGDRIEKMVVKALVAGRVRLRT
ncbi:MAG TPA: hypothetical protein VFZ43_09465 [Anaerolineales bacterium]